MKTMQRGFTLIELMIVVAIVGILAAIALPAYQDYMARAKQTEPLAKLDELKLSVAEYVASNNATPDNQASAGFGAAGAVITTGFGAPTYYDGIGYQEITNNTTVAVGVRLTGSANTNLDDKWLIMTGTVDSASGTVSWQCGSDVSTTYVKLLPANCRGAAAIVPN